MMNPIALMKLKPLFEQFRERHPKFVEFLGFAPQQLGEDSFMEIKITRADGYTTKTSIRVSAEDLDLVEQLRQLTGKGE